MACMDPDKPHVLCKYSRDTVLPTRVLDVSNPADDESTVRLQVSETEVHQQYLALSYCWGKQPKSTSPTKTVQLRKENTADLISGFRLDSLQQSLQDAVFVTRKLGFRYLWIDAMCIIQNCEDDKQREISRMASIYKNATVCIAASTSKNAAHGFLTNKGPAYLPDHKFRISMNEGEIGTVHLSAEDYEPEHPLDTRAWALQEFMLSSRLLIFSDYELLWQCKEVSLRGVTGNGLDYVQPLEDLPWAVFDSDGDSYFGNQDFDRLYLWKTVVRQYTDRKLTDPNDRLPAITGITTELQTLWNDVNIYGLWRRWFVSLLAWYKPNSEREKKRHLKRAPSWSWASLDGVIYFEGPLIKEDAQVKLLTISSAELTGRILTYDEVSKDEKKLDTISEWSDLKDPISELRKMKSADAEAEYLLLGTAKSKQYGEIGIGLVVVNVGGGMYRRIGLAKFLDMSVWAESRPRDVTLEPKRASRR
ncbi:heterokaryon incompatibility protein [Pochonia chlamydosporia 170]|uniref:Heterokaryon incompatibility protein n=1 Tax=Pochonia chlamydosporia 170 TaxID=1380566 RepID=A0A179G144_METCM|nr:heterokaryon incompatibility protein [Pochonia chlamydosporia 170]OAQ70969.1 heterokaryon incompatibility protein [Pochonia chlamydosporia 170]